jgi:DNA-nicking Smr family endonuclease
VSAKESHDELWAAATRGTKVLKGKTKVKAPAHTKPRPEPKPAPRVLRKPDFDTRIDLHGLTLAKAHRALERFIIDSAADGARRVLVVTGKGAGRTSIRGEIAHWLEVPRLRGLVAGVSAVDRHQGGEGAIAIQLRRTR